ncbi:MAG TPA: hypothetical protein VF297_26090 [Pyrinomonadaceae bacterium]
MNFMRALTRLVVGMSRLGDYLLRQKVRGIVVAALAFACGAGLAYALKGEPEKTNAVAVVATQLPARAVVSMRDTDVDEDEAERAVFDKGVYENYVYGYSVRIPDGMIGLGSAPPAPQHGFGIALDYPRSTNWTHEDEFPKSYVYVDGSYNSLEWKRLDEVVNAHLEYLREDSADVHVQSRTRTRLGSLRAARLVAHYEEGVEEMVSDQVFAFRVEEDGARSVVYTLGLTTPRLKYERDRAVLEELMRNWRLQPVE